MTPSREMTQEQWQATLGSWVRTTSRRGETLHGSFEANIVGDCLIAVIQTSAQEGLRTVAMTQADRLDHILVHCVRSGVLVFGLDDGPRAEKGGLMIVDLAEPSRIVCSDIAVLTIGLPRRLVAPALGAVDSGHGLTIPPEHPSAMVFQTLATTVHRHGIGSSSRVQHALSAALAALAVDAIESGSPMLRPAANGNLSQRPLRSYIAAHYTDPDLGADRLADLLGVSRATIYRMQASEDELSLHQRIRQVRTRAALGRIAVASHMDSCGEIAEACGFASINEMRNCVERETGRSLEQLVFEGGARSASQVPAHARGDRSFSWWLSSL